MGRPAKPDDEKFVPITVRVPRAVRDAAVASCEGGRPLQARLASAVYQRAGVPDPAKVDRPSLIQREIERRMADARTVAHPVDVEPRFKGKG